MNTAADLLAIRFMQNACQYYATARFAMHAQCMPVCGTLFHHTVEMILKAGLVRKRKLSDLKDMKHRLKVLWRAFKADFPDPTLKRHDKTISSLDKFEAIRYPDIAHARDDGAVFRSGGQGDGAGQRLAETIRDRRQRYRRSDS
jgi:hypothetical protein